MNVGSQFSSARRPKWIHIRRAGGRRGSVKLGLAQARGSAPKISEVVRVPVDDEGREITIG